MKILKTRFILSELSTIVTIFILLNSKDSKHFQFFTAVKQGIIIPMLYVHFNKEYRSCFELKNGLTVFKVMV